jgi:hypothetical protein
MESTPRHVLPGVAGPAHPGARRVRQSGHRRRPTGAPPPLPRSIQPTGVWWAAAAVVLVALARVAFGPTRDSLGVAVTVWDDAVVRRLAGLRLPGLTGLMEAVVAATGSVVMIAILRGGTLLALIPAVPIALAFAVNSTTPGSYKAVKGGDGSCTEIEELWLQAQSVPSASRVPCIRALPLNTTSQLRVQNGQSVLELRSTTGPDVDVNVGTEPQAPEGGVAVRLTAACDAPTQGEGQTVAPGVRRFQLEGTRSTPEVVDVFPGGCLTYQPGAGTAATLLDQVERAVSFRTRDELRHALRHHSNGRLQLDPQAAERLCGEAALEPVWVQPQDIHHSVAQRPPASSPTTDRLHWRLPATTDGGGELSIPCHNRSHAER